MTPSAAKPATRVVVAGARGRLGHLAAAAIREAPDLELVGELVRGDDWQALLTARRPDVLVDLTLAAVSREQVPPAAELGIRPVVGTSGLTDDDLRRLAGACAAGGVGGLVVPNFSLGAVLQMQVADQLARHFSCSGIHEVHHTGKRDSPSGTARATAERVAASGGRPPPITSDRRDDCLAEQDVHFVSPEGHESLTVRHVVTDRAAYLPGLLLAVRRVGDLEGLRRGLEVVLP